MNESIFYYSEVNDWGEVVYYPTGSGVALLLFLIFAVITLALVLSAIEGKKAAGIDTADPDARIPLPANPLKMSAKQLTFCAVSIALGMVLSEIKLYHFPTGGSITLVSMLMVTLPGYLFGPGAGLFSAVGYGLLQLLIDPYVLYPGQLVLDYILAFGLLGLSGFFWLKKYGLIKGYLVGVTGRFLMSFLSGWIFFGAYAWDGWSPWAYSLVYNAIYIYAEALLTVVILALPPVRNAIRAVRNFAHN